MNVRDALNKKLRKAINLNVKKITKTQEKIGKWHDKDCTLSFLTKQNFPTKKGKAISTLKAQEKKLFNSLFSESA